MTVPQSSLFDVFQSTLPACIQLHQKRADFFWFVELLAGWPIVAPTKKTSADLVKDFMKSKVIPPPIPPNTAVSNKGRASWPMYYKTS